MCGIIGIASNKPVSTNIINSLKKLEYRGYDSAGLATLTQDNINEKKCSGRVEKLEKILFKTPSNGNIGIGHVRWATHGVPNVVNAHPHSSEQVSVVHNGIIENSDEIKRELEFGAFIRDNNIITNINTEEFTMPLSNLTLQGKHNTKNAMAATMAAQLLKVRKESIKESLSTFEGAEHRLENVAKINEVYFINDSKATNVNATFYALECMDKSTVWIVGGVDKGNDYNDLLPLVREKVSSIVCLGIDNEKIKKTFQNVVDIIVETAGAEEAVKVSKKLANKGDVVLFSPACASFDLFDNYEDRGRQFKKAVRSL